MNPVMNKIVLRVDRRGLFVHAYLNVVGDNRGIFSEKVNLNSRG